MLVYSHARLVLSWTSLKNQPADKAGKPVKTSEACYAGLKYNFSAVLKLEKQQANPRKAIKHIFCLFRSISSKPGSV